MYFLSCNALWNDIYNYSSYTFFSFLQSVFLPVSGKVAKEVIEASSKIQREPPQVRR